MKSKTRQIVDMLRTIADRIESAEDPESCRLAMLFVGPEREEQATTLACSLTIGEGEVGRPFIDAMLQLTSYLVTGRRPHQWEFVPEPATFVDEDLGELHPKSLVDSIDRNLQPFHKGPPSIAEEEWERRYARREAWRKLHCTPECGGNWSQCCPGCHGAIPEDFQPEEKK